MKRFLTLLLSGLLVLSSLLFAVACDGSTTEPGTTTPPATTPTDPTYTVKIIDEAGNPVSGVEVQFCTDSGCSPISTASDADGMIVATQKADAYKVQLTSVPAGYVKDEIYRTFNENNYVEIVLAEAPLGSEENPEIIVSDSLLVTLTAGQTYYVAVRNPGAQQILIEDPNAVITYSENAYTAVDGVLVLPLNNVSGDGRTTAVLGVSASDGKAATFTVKIESLPGTMGNPYPLNSLDELSVSLPKDTTVYYQWTATENGNFCASRTDDNTNIVLIVNSRTTGDMSKEESAPDKTLLGVEKGETVLIGISALNRNESTFTVSFEMTPADPNAEFTYVVSVGTLLAGIPDVTVEIYNANDELITTVVTDTEGKAIYTNVWMDAYAKIILPDGYTLYQGGGDVEPSDRTEFYLRSGSFGTANAIFTLVPTDLGEEE